MALPGETDNEADATPLEGNPLCPWLGYGPEFGDGVGHSSAAAAADTDEVGTHCHDHEGAVDLARGRGRLTLPAAAGSLCWEQDCGEH